MEKLIANIKTWTRKNRKEFFILILILAIGAILRLYKIDGYMTFLGDEGRDVIIVRRLLVDFDLILIGPRTSIGDMYLGPLYYYMMAPALLLSAFNPVGPAIMIALFGVVTIFFVWYVTRKWFTMGNVQGVSLSMSALVAAGLYAISPVVIEYSRSSWNPNIMPFFALLTIYSVWKFWHEMKFRWLIVTGVSMAFVMQSHYLGLLLIPTIGFFWLLSYLRLFKSRSTENEKQKTVFVKYTLLTGALFVLLMSPLVIFDARHGWRNFSSMSKFFNERQTTVSARPWTAIPKAGGIFQRIVTRLITGKNAEVGKYMTLIFEIGIVALAISLMKSRFKDKESRAYLLLFTWLGVAIIGLGVYKQHIYDHYYGFFYPAPFILLGALAQKLYSKFGNDGKIFATAIIAFLVITNLLNNPLRYSPNYQMQRATEAARLIKQESKGMKYNLAVIAERNYEDGYQYFLEKWGEPVSDIDPLKLEETIAEQLFVVCEMEKEKCDPVHSPKAEIANFGWSRVDNQWDVSGVTVYKLVRSQ